MRNMPVFTTEYGVASLTLQEIPYKQEAYIRIQSTQQPEGLLSECISFCRACGAEKIFATGNEYLNRYPLYTQIWQMRCPVDALPQTDAALFPVQQETLEKWRQCYNDRMADVPNAATMTLEGGKKLLEEGNGYFVHREERLLGIGKASGDRLDAVASLIPGAGREVVAALCHALRADSVLVEVASENLPAVRLYEKLGFIRTSLLSTWYRVF